MIEMRHAYRDSRTEDRKNLRPGYSQQIAAPTRWGGHPGFEVGFCACEPGEGSFL